MITVAVYGGGRANESHMAARNDPIAGAEGLLESAVARVCIKKKQPTKPERDAEEFDFCSREL